MTDELCNSCIFEDFGHCLAWKYGEEAVTEVEYNERAYSTIVVKCSRYVKVDNGTR